MVTQRVLEVERAARVAAEAHAAKLAAHNARLRAALPPGTDIPDEAEGDEFFWFPSAAASRHRVQLESRGERANLLAGADGLLVCCADEVVAASEDGDEAAADEPSSTAAAALVTSAQKTEPVPATAPEA